MNRLGEPFYKPVPATHWKDNEEDAVGVDDLAAGHPASTRTAL